MKLNCKSGREQRLQPQTGKDTGRGQNESSEGLRENYGLNSAFTNR